jgi:hypothetical protein
MRERPCSCIIFLKKIKERWTRNSRIEESKIAALTKISRLFNDFLWSLEETGTT